MIKSCLILFFLFITLSAQAQRSLANAFSVSTYNPGDSTIEIDAQLAEDINWVWIQVIKGSKKEDIFIDTKTEEFPVTSYLRFGPGQYTLNVFVNTSADKYSPSYFFKNKFEIINDDERSDVGSVVPSSDIQSHHPKIVSLAEEITAGLQNDMEKTKAIHKWMTNNIAYDVESFFTGSYVKNKHDALSILEARKAVCEGYSNLTAALNRAIGIPAKKVKGEAIMGNQAWTGRTNHAWNETLINGAWIVQDTTWDAGHVDYTKQTFKFDPKMKYFNPSPEEFAKDHKVER